MKKSKWQCRWSPTLGSLEGTSREVWGTDDYTDDARPTVFFGIYGMPDFYALWRHKGIREVLWTGSDIRHFVDGFWLEEGGKVRMPAINLAPWLSRNCGHWVENHVEQDKLAEVGIHARVCPSFLGNVNDFRVEFKPGNALYTSVSGDDFDLYGWHRIPEIAEYNDDIQFHLFGNSKPFEPTKHLSNVIDHGRVSRKVMNNEIIGMQGALRLTEFDGFSEILSKSVLWGQWPVSLIRYPWMLTVQDIHLILEKDAPNHEGRTYYRGALNKYPWNQNA